MLQRVLCLTLYIVAMCSSSKAVFGLVTVWEFVSKGKSAFVNLSAFVIVKLCLVWLPFRNLSAFMNLSA